MRNINIIHAPEKAMWIDESWMPELPIGILNKKQTGVGGSTLALTNKLNTILAVPNIELIDNKCAQHNKDTYNVFGIKGGVTIGDFNKYLDQLGGKPVKIMVTYDSFHKVEKWCTTDITDWSVVIDEYQEVLDSYDYRSIAIDSMLHRLSKYTRVTYLSATPIPFNYVPAILKGVQEYEIKWANTIILRPYRIKSTKPYLNAIHLIQNHRDNGWKSVHKGHTTTELYFFINSVTAIRNLIDNSNLNPEDVKIICSDTIRNAKVLEGYNISKVLDENKPITFVTSKAFKGADFYSKDGLCIIVSEVKNKHTLLDMATSIHQIAGRIRNLDNPFRHTLIHIYNTGAANMTQLEFDELVKRKQEITAEWIKATNGMSTKTRKLLRSRMEAKNEDDYIKFDKHTNTASYNELRMLNETRRYNIVSGIYQNGLTVRTAYKDCGYDVTEKQEFVIEEGDMVYSASRYSFRDIAKSYIVKYKAGDDMQQMNNEYPMLRDLTAKFGVDKISALQYSKSKIEAYLLDTSDNAIAALTEQIPLRLELGVKYSSKHIKKTLTELYNTLGITSLPATIKGLDGFFTCTKHRTRVGKKVTTTYSINKLESPYTIDNE